VPFPKSFRETLAMQLDNANKNNQITLFYSARKKIYSDREIRRRVEKYSKLAGLSENISPFTLRHFLLAWLKKRGLEDELIMVDPIGWTLKRLL